MIDNIYYIFCVLLVMYWVKVVTDKNIDDAYKEGQVDALNGKIKYEKTLNSDGETVWTEIKK